MERTDGTVYDWPLRHGLSIVKDIVDMMNGTIKLESKENEYKRHFMSGVVRNYFENSYKEMVSFFAKDRKISTDDLKDIIDLIEKGKED